jgi:hypothetical protein
VKPSLGVKSFTVDWSQKDQEWVATCPDFPSLSWLAPGPIQALAGLTKLIREFRRDSGEKQ